jgi:membrane fusion protein (multidrug efflux system)
VDHVKYFIHACSRLPAQDRAGIARATYAARKFISNIPTDDGVEDAVLEDQYSRYRVPDAQQGRPRVWCPVCVCICERNNDEFKSLVPSAMDCFSFARLIGCRAIAGKGSMPVTFTQTMRSLEADGFRRPFGGLAFGGFLLVVVFGWAFLARIQVYEVSQQARLEVEREAHPVAAPVEGRVVAAYLELGRAVQPGDVLLELDSEGQQLRLAEEQTQLTVLRRRVDALEQEVRAEEEAWPAEQRAAAAAVKEAHSRHREATAAARFADEESTRLMKLAAGGVISRTELERVQTEEEQKHAVAAALSVAVERLQSEEQAKEKAHQARLAKLHSDLVALEGEVATRTQAVGRAEYEIQQRRIVAMEVGHLAEIASLRPGSFVQSGTRIGTILPDGELKAVAHFPPVAALGRILPGQPARLRLEGFNWTQFGSVAATVTGVANEPRDGLVRVEFSVDRESAPRIPFQHGLQGSVEVIVERVAPAVLLLRTVGKFLKGAQTTSGDLPVPNIRHVQYSVSWRSSGKPPESGGLADDQGL